MMIGIRKLLIAAQPVQSLVADRIYPVTLPQSPTMPAITYLNVSGQRVHSTTRALGLSMPRMQIDCWSDKYDDALTLAEHVRRAIDAFRGTVDTYLIQGIFFRNERYLFESEPRLHRISRDYLVCFEED